jgi:Txe/YoeB family toxin of Txe-Axe toxin-antitoxin module
MPQKKFGVSEYTAVYEERFVQNLKRYAALRQQINRRVDRILKDPYTSTEYLTDLSGKLNLIGCRSARIDRNFRLIFVICEECRHVLTCEFCFCDRLPDETILFLTVGPHDRAYAME